MTRAAHSGFTLVEALVAVAILLIGFLALSTLHVGAFRANGLARRTTLGTVLAYAQLERFHRLGFDNVSNGTDVATLDGRTFSRGWTVTANGTGSKTVVVSVTWTDQWGGHSISIPGVVRR